VRPYETNPSTIYAASFATVRAEARLDRFAPAMHPLITRLIHSCGMVEIADRLAFSPAAVQAGSAAKEIGNTRSAAAVELWRDRIEGAVVAVGNAPTALFHLLELIDSGWPKPAVILGFPVGFIGAAESKAELAGDPRGCEFVALRGRRGGSAMASAAVNALAAGLPEDV